MGTESKIDVTKFIEVHMVMDGVGTKGWVHTHGMDRLDRPDLEVRDVPTFLMHAAGAILNRVADIMVNGNKPVKLGETIQLTPLLPFRLKKLAPLPGDEAHFVHERWALCDLEPHELGGFCVAHSPSLKR